MRVYPFVTVDVFTDCRFGGNQLAVFTDAYGLSDAEMQALAAELNLSETTFVLPPSDPAHTARVRIFNRTAEMPFAGHPNVGTGFVLGQMGRDAASVLLFEEPAGLVEVRLERDGKGRLSGATIAAPQPLRIGAELAPATAAACGGLRPEDVITAAHPPVEASVGVEFVIMEVKAEALGRAAPQLDAFRRAADELPALGERLALHLYAHDRERLRARMFAPLSGTYEDPATGSAGATLAALLLSLGTSDEGRWDIVQGVEIGRPSLLRASAHRASDGVRARVGGGCVPVLRGEAVL
jgi:trans-2,3-dihydro-3-hydroxyanthranilate isomerase